jgi:hypothetical protein
LTTQTAENETDKTLTPRHLLYSTLVASIQAPHQSGETINWCGLNRWSELEIGGWHTIPGREAERPQTNVLIAVLLVLERKNLITKTFVFQVRNFCKDR